MPSIPDLYDLIRSYDGGQIVADVSHRETVSEDRGSVVEFRVLARSREQFVLGMLQQELVAALERYRPVGIEYVVRVVGEDQVRQLDFEDWSPARAFPTPPTTTSKSKADVVETSRFAMIAAEMTNPPTLKRPDYAPSGSAKPLLGKPNKPVDPVDYWDDEEYDYVGEKRPQLRPPGVEVRDLPKFDKVAERELDAAVKAGLVTPEQAQQQVELNQVIRYALQDFVGKPMTPERVAAAEGAIKQALAALIQTGKYALPPGVEFDRVVFGADRNLKVLFKRSEPKTELSTNPDGSLKCMRCGGSAFEVGFVEPNRQPAVSCRGCKPPAPVYLVDKLPDDIRSKVNAYRCSRCRKRSDVLMELSDVSLWCVGCNALVVHTKEGRAQMPGTVWKPDAKVVADPPWSTTSPKAWLSSKDWPPKAQSSSDLADAATYAVRMSNPARAILDEMADAVQKQFDLKPEDLARAVEGVRGLAESMRVQLRLEPFDKYAFAQRTENAGARKLKERDWDRRTGRTWCGIVHALARVSLFGCKRLYLVGGSDLMSEEMEVLAKRFIEKLNDGGVALDVSIKIPPSGKQREIDQAANPDVVLHRDHTWYERNKVPMPAGIVTR